MKHIKVIIIVCVIMILASFSGCLQEPEKPSSIIVTPVVSVSPTISVTAPVKTPLETVRTPSSYIVFIDDYSFYKVTETTNKDFEYKNFTLNINTGDTVEWRNEATYNDKLTLVSNQGLWTPGEIRAILIDRGFNYTFNNPGTYTFRIKEEPRILPQTIIVKQ